MKIETRQMLSKLTILIPAYNESENIKNVLSGLIPIVKEFACKVIIVNDGSTDDTALFVHQFMEINPSFQLIIVSHSRNRGYGAALKTGINTATTEFILTIDADGQHSVDDLPSMFEQLISQQADLCIGNRSGQGSTFMRNFVKKTLLRFVNFFLKTHISDLNSGMKLYRTAIVQRLIKFAPNGMPFSDAIVLLHHQFRFKIIDFPIQVTHRAGGQSTVNYKTGIYTIAEVLNLVINFFPFKFFLYLAVLLFLIGFAWGLPFFLNGKGLTTGASFLWLTSLNLLFFGLIMENLVRLRYDRFEYPRPVQSSNILEDEED